MFLKSDEHLLVMNSNEAAKVSGLPWKDLTTDQLRRIREECGVKVATEHIYWSLVEDKPGEYDWSLADKQVRRCRDAGLRLIISSPLSPPRSLPNRMYASYRNGSPFREILSFWNPESIEYEVNFLKTLVDRYSGPDVTIMYAGHIGESYLWNAPIYFDEAARADFSSKYTGDLEDHSLEVTPELRDWIADGVVNHCLALQEVLVEQHNEVWDPTQYIIAMQSVHNGVFARPQVLKAYQERWPDATRWLLQYTYWMHGPDNTAVVDEALEKYDCLMAVEADYCRGLASDPSTAQLAVEGGINKKNPERWRAQVVCPLHPFGKEKELKPWMMEAMKNAVETWQGAVDNNPVRAPE